MTGRGQAGAVAAAVEAYYGKPIGTLRMLAAGIPADLVEVLEPELGRLEAEVGAWRAGERLPDETVLDLYLGTFDPEHPEDDVRPLADAAAEDEHRARLLLRRGLEALGYGLESDPHAPTAITAPRRPVGSALPSQLRGAEQHVLEQYRLAVLAALTAAGLEPLHEAQEHLYLPFATRAPDSKRWHARGVELDWTDNRQPKNGRSWHYGPLDIWLGAGWELYEPLPLPPFAHPEDIAAVARHLLLTGDHYIAPRTREWEHAHALTVLLELVEAARTDAGRPPPSI